MIKVMSATKRDASVLITGGAGYIGSRLTRRLLAAGLRVRVLDLMVFGNGLEGITDDRLDIVRGDIRDARAVRQALAGMDSVVHLAAVANDPGFDLDPDMARTVNYTCLDPLVGLAKKSGVRRFVYASSASVYGRSEAARVDEDHPLQPITDYGRYKALGEEVLFAYGDAGFETVAVRAATVCGYSPRQRFDLSVNRFTAQALVNREIALWGGDQHRPNIHIEDLTAVYERLVRADTLGEGSGRPVNVGHENLTVADIVHTVAERVGRRLGTEIEVKHTAFDDHRSYRLDAQRLVEWLGYRPALGIAAASDDVADALVRGLLPDSLTDPRYYNVQWMRRHPEKWALAEEPAAGAGERTGGGS
jgi:nucleoside-diphosphate-sugar epimerase